MAGSSFMVQAAVEHMQGHSLEQNCSVVNLSSISAHQTQPNRQALLVSRRHIDLGVEQNRNRNFVQESKFLFPSEDYQKYRHYGYNCQEKSIIFRMFKVKVKGCSSGFLPAGISGSL